MPASGATCMLPVAGSKQSPYIRGVLVEIRVEPQRAQAGEVVQNLPRVAAERTAHEVTGQDDLVGVHRPTNSSQPWQNAVRIEMLRARTRRRRRRAARSRARRPHGVHRAVEVGERQQSHASGDVASDAGVLHDHRPARGEVAGAAIAEPAGAAGGVAVLDDGELAARAADVVAVRIRRRGSAGAARSGASRWLRAGA